VAALDRLPVLKKFSSPELTENTDQLKRIFDPVFVKKKQISPEARL